MSLYQRVIFFILYHFINLPFYCILLYNHWIKKLPVSFNVRSFDRSTAQINSSNQQLKSTAQINSSNQQLKSTVLIDQQLKTQKLMLRWYLYDSYSGSTDYVLLLTLVALIMYYYLLWYHWLCITTYSGTTDYVLLLTLVALIMYYYLLW